VILSDGRLHSSIYTLLPEPRIIFVGLIEGDATKGYTLPFRIGSNVHSIHLALSLDPDSFDPPMPLPGNEWWWAYKRRVFSLDPPPLDQLESADLAELQLRIKHAAIRQEKALTQIRREVEAFENSERLPSARRERIPDSVRLFVWQRDNGVCVRCGSNQKLEFDHIIPVIKGGANTERNIQLLCETCNRQKGESI